MRAEILYMLGIILVGFAVNYALRALPFVLFSGKRRELPKWVEPLGSVLSPIIIAALVVYSFATLKLGPEKTSALKTAWPYLAGIVTVALQLWRKNPLVSIVAGTVLYMCLITCGCTTTDKVLVLDAAHPSIRYSTKGILIGERYVEPLEVPRLLEEYEVPHDRVIHILVDEEAVANLKPAHVFMHMLAKHGYTRSMLVTKKHADSHVVTEAERAAAERQAQSRAVRSSGTGKRKIRYKGANE